MLLSCDLLSIKSQKGISIKRRIKTARRPRRLVSVLGQKGISIKRRIKTLSVEPQNEIVSRVSERNIH